LGLREPFVELFNWVWGDVGNIEGGPGVVFSQIGESLRACGGLLHDDDGF
jgi:hypothetical protein